MMDIYINHRSNQAEAELQVLGLTPISAHAVNGSLIGMSIVAYRNYNMNEDISCVSPKLGSIRTCQSEDDIHARLNELRSYWRLKKYDITSSYNAQKQAVSR